MICGLLLSEKKNALLKLRHEKIDTKRKQNGKTHRNILNKQTARPVININVTTNQVNVKWVLTFVLSLNKPLGELSGVVNF